MNRQEIEAIYDAFSESGKNMSREVFIKEMRLLTDPQSMQRDLAEIQTKRAQEQVNRSIIDRGLEQNGRAVH